MKEQKKDEFYLDEYRFDLSKPLNDSYDLLGVLGAGSDGIVLHIKNKRTNHPLALKLVLEYKSIFIAIEKTVASKSDLFARCYGVFVCDKLPDEWVKAIKKKGRRKGNEFKYVGEIYYGYFYEYAGTDFVTWIKQNDLTKVKNGSQIVLGILFEVLYALIWSFEEFGFLHTDVDIHLHNIMVTPTPYVRVYYVEGKYYAINPGFSIKLIDFDRAKLNKKGKVKELTHDVIGLLKRLDAATYADEKTTFFDPLFDAGSDWDVNDFFREIDRIMWDWDTQPFYDIFGLEGFEQFEVEEESEPTFQQSPSPKRESPSLSPGGSPQFDLGQERSTKRLKQMSCHICGNVSTRALANRPSLTFCANDECVLKLGDLVHMM